MLGNKILATKRSRQNGTIVVMRTLGVGNYIQSGGITQSGGVVGNLWKRAIKSLKGKDIKSALILGLGGGTVAGVIQKVFPSAKIVGVEIDPVMIEMGERFLGLDRKKIKVILKDVNYFQTKNKFDLVVVDLYKGQVFPGEFESPVFLKKIGRFLKKDGVIIFNRLRRGAAGFEKKLKNEFSSVEVKKPLINILYYCSLSGE